MEHTSETKLIRKPVHKGYLPQTLAIGNLIRNLYGGEATAALNATQWIELLDTIEAYFGDTLARAYTVGMEAGFEQGLTAKQEGHTTYVNETV